MSTAVTAIHTCTLELPLLSELLHPVFSDSLIQLLWACLAFFKFWVEIVVLLKLFKLASLNVTSVMTTEQLSQKTTSV